MADTLERKGSFVSKYLECSVCKETLLDPRALPCGHSYCGPEKDCLQAVRMKKGGLKCTVCQEKCALNISQLKPLYGIRDYLKDIQSSSASYSDEGNKYPFMDCESHAGRKAKFWCVNCEMKICSECVEVDHDEHSMSTLRKYFHKEVASRLNENFRTFFKFVNEVRYAEDNMARMSDIRHTEIRRVDEYLKKLAVETERMDCFRSVYGELEKFVGDINYDIDYDIVELFLKSELFNFQKTKSLLAEQYAPMQLPDLSLSFKTKIFVSEGKECLNYFKFKVKEVNFSVGSRLFQSEEFGMRDCLSIEINWVVDISIIPDLEFSGEVSLIPLVNKNRRYSIQTITRGYHTHPEDGGSNKMVVNLDIGYWQTFFGPKVANNVWSCILGFTINFPAQKVQLMDRLFL